VVAGIFFGILFGAANAYLGLLVGITVSTSIPVAVMTVGLFRLGRRFFGRTTILESNMSQTIGSASSSLASGVIFTLPALFLWGMNPSIFQMAGLAVLGGFLGILFMIPLRRFLIKQEHKSLPYPEGTACAKVLIASDKGGTKSGNIFMGLAVGFFYKCCYAILQLWPDKVSVNLPFLNKAQIGMKTYPVLLGVGYILGYRISAIMVAGSLVSWLVLIPLLAHIGENLAIPLFPETTMIISEMSPSEIWNRYIRYVGAGAVAFGGIMTIIRSIPTMIKSIKLGAGEIKARLNKNPNPVQNGPAEADRTDKDVSLVRVVVGVALVIAVLAIVPNLLGGSATITLRLVAAPAIAVFAFFFVTVSSRIVGLVGVTSNPTSGMTIVTLIGISLVFVAIGWTDAVGMATVLMVGTVVCVAASIAGDTSQDLKTGFIVGATPYKQQIGELIGAASSALAVCASVVILNNIYQFGSIDLPAPQATLVKTIVEGLLQSGIPWGLVLAGFFLGAIIELCSLPSLPFAVGLYLPVSSMVPIFIGGCIRQFIENRYKENQKELAHRREQGILFGSGLIGGEGLLGVGIALYAFYLGKPKGIGLDWPEPIGLIISLVLFAGLGYLLFRRTGSYR
jgi:putative OPT family oligopeptide transporter